MLEMVCGSDDQYTMFNKADLINGLRSVFTALFNAACSSVALAFATKSNSIDKEDAKD